MAIPEGAIPFSELDLSKLQADTEARPPAGAIPADQLDPSKLTQADGPPPGAIPADSIPASAIQTDEQYLESAPRRAMASEAVAAQQRGETNLSKYENAYVKKSNTLDILDSDARAKSVAPLSPLEAAASAVPGGSAVIWAHNFYDSAAEGTFTAMNEVAKTAGLDLMAARWKTPAERAGQPGGTPFLLPNVTQDASLQSANTVVTAAHLKTLQAVDMLRTFSNRVANRILYSADKEQGIGQAEMDANFRAQFRQDLAVETMFKGLEQYGTSVTAPAPDPATIEKTLQTPLLDPTLFIPAGAAFKAARAGEGLAARTLAIAPVTVGEFLSKESGKILAKPIDLMAKTVGRAGELVDTSPLLKATVAAAVAGGLGGDAVQAGLAALIGANTKLGNVGKLGAGAANKLTGIADTLAARVPPGPMGRFGASVVRTIGDEAASVVAGQMLNLPFVLGAGDEESAKNLVFAGTVMHGMTKAAGTMANGLDITRNLWAERPTMPDARLNVKPYGFDDKLDAAHRKVAEGLGNSANNYVQLVRDYFGKNRGEIYTLYPADYNAAIDSFVAAGHLDATTALQAKSQQGLAVRVPGEDGVVRNIALSRVAGAAPGLSVGHESGHLLENILSPEEISHVYAEIAKTYGPEQMAAYKTRYEDLANQGNTSTKIVLSPQQLLSEIFAEHASAVLNSIPIEQFSSPNMKTKDLSRMVYGLVARGMEKLGVKVPQLTDFSGETSGPKTGLGIQPSAKIGNIIENMLQAHALDLPKLKQVFDTPTGKPPISKEQATLGKTPKPAAEAKPAEPSIGPTHPVTDETPFGAHVAPAGTAEQIVAPKQTENVVRPEGVPNVRVQPSAQNAFGEATPERIAKTLEHLDKAFSGQRSDIAPVEIVYHSAKSDVSGPDQRTREAQRIAADRLEKASKDAGLPNPLRAKYQKITVPYGYARPDKSLLHAMSLDKVVHNVDLLQGWLHLNPDADKGGDLSQYLASPELTKDFQTYLENQSHGYAGDGSPLVRPSNTREGTVTPQDTTYKSKPLPPDKAQVLNMLMGMEQPGRMTPGQEYAARFARENGIEAVPVKGVLDTNPLRARLRNEHGFDPKILNAAVEVLKTNRIVDLKERSDLNFKAGDTAFQRAGFMPAAPRPGAKEWIEEAALRLKDGTILRGRSHPSIMMDAVDSGMATENSFGDFHFRGGEPADGFVTNSGKFVSRESAYKIARDAGQTPDEGPKGSAESIGLENYAASQRPTDFSEFPYTNGDVAAVEEALHSVLSPEQAKEAVAFRNSKGASVPELEKAFPALEKSNFRAQLEDYISNKDSASFMPQLKGPKLEHSVPEKELKLIHYGDPGLSEINGSKFGRSGVTPRSELAGAPRSYWYEAGKENRHDIVLGRGSKYDATVSGNRIYDGDSDPLKYGKQINRWKADTMLQNAGYAGIRRTAGTGKNAYSQVELFEPIKPDNGMKKAASFMPATNGEKFFSPLEKTLRGIPDKANPEQIRAALRGTKAEEMRDVKDPTGQSFEEYLRSNPEATKQELLDFANQHRVVVNEKLKGNNLQDMGYTYDHDQNGEPFLIDSKTNERFWEDEWKNLPNGVEKLARIASGKSRDSSEETKYENYVLPGGTNYREAVFTLPPKESFNNWLERTRGSTEEKVKQYAGDVERSLRRDYARENGGYTSSHFSDVPDYLAHARYNERSTPQGDALHAEEIQSDLHQAGRKEGYDKSAADKAVLQAELIKVSTEIAASGKALADAKDAVWAIEDIRTPEMRAASNLRQEIETKHKELLARRQSLQEQLLSGKIPDAPFKKTWHELVFKQLLRTAAEKGKDWLTWTTGDQQAERYDLSKQVDTVWARKRADGTYSISVNEKGKSGLTGIAGEAKESELPGLVGKELAQKIITQDVHTAPMKYSGVDLKVGGEGMKGFYDEILPRFADKYLKKYGIKTEAVTAGTPTSSNWEVVNLKSGESVAGPFRSREEAMRHVSLGGVEVPKQIGGDTVVHGVHLTPELKKAILEKGQPLYMPNGQRQGNNETRDLARSYMDARGIATAQHTENAPVNEALAKKIADFYDEAKHDPQAPEVKQAYDALAKETMAQYAEMEKAGIAIQPWDGKGEPYANSAAMMQDVRENKHLWFFKTDNGFGEAKAPDNALLEKSGVKIDGHELLVNDVFRAVHDYFGHTAEGWEFGPRGELNAYLTHAKMFSDEAKPALAAETLAQNSWVNYGKHLRDENGNIAQKGELGYVPLKDRKFADQKNIAIPHAFLREAEGLPPEAPLARAKVAARKGALAK